MAEEAARVAQRCTDAQSTGELMLNECGLRKFPDAVFLFLRGVEVQRVSLANNQFPKIPAKVPSSEVFAAVTSFDLSNNTLSSLPDTFSTLQNLSEVLLSGNHFGTFPNVLTQIPSLTKIDLGSNKIETVDQSMLDSLPPQVTVLDLTENPLTDDSKAFLKIDARVKY